MIQMMRRLFVAMVVCLAIGVKANAQDNAIHTPKGTIVKIFTDNAGTKIKLNDVVTFDVIQKTDKDSLLFSSYTLGHPLKLQVQPAQNVGDLMDVLVLLAEKDSAFVKIPSDSVFVGHEDQRPPFLKKGSFLTFTLKIHKAQSLEAAMAEVKTAETDARNKYVADNKLNVTTTPSGLEYVITQPSLKRKPLKGDTVLVNYTGMNLNGKIFDSSIKENAEKGGLNQPGRNYEPLTVILGTTPIIKGWDEGLLLLGEGAKAKLIIPSSIGYGAEGAGADIAPYSTLVFDVELVKIKPIKHAAKPPVKKGPAKKRTTTKKKS